MAISKKPALGVYTGGGDTAGLNAFLYFLNVEARENGWEVIGFRNGIDGFINADTVNFDSSDFSKDLIRKPSTVLGSTRAIYETDQIIDVCRQRVEEFQLNGLVATCGDGSARNLYSLSHTLGIPVAAAAKSVDNNMGFRTPCLGFRSAAMEVARIINTVRNSSVAHKNCTVIEVMGRDEGHLALLSACLADNVDGVIVPEIPNTPEAWLPIIKDNLATKQKQYDERSAKRRLINPNPSFTMIVAEGALKADGTRIEAANGNGAPLLGGIGEHFANAFKANGLPFRYQPRSYTPRGAAPDFYDIRLAEHYAKECFAAILNAHNGNAARNAVMATYDGDIMARDVDETKFGIMPLADAIKQDRIASPDYPYFVRAKEANILLV